jgi:hypothetical protein
MMSLFGNLKTEGLEEAQDRLGGFQLFDTDAYEATITLAYAGQSSGGAMNVTLVADIDGREYKETVYVTNKKGENFFLNQQDPTKKVPLPGFTTIDDLCLVTTDAPLSAQTTEEKVVKVYDPDLRAEAPKSVQVLTSLLGKQVYLGITRSLVNKQEKDSNGEYQPVADTREENTIEKIFHYPTKATVVEAKNGADPAFFDKWLAKNRGVTRDRRKIKDGEAQSGRPSRGAASSGPPQAGASGGAAPRTSLFGGPKA